MLPAERKRRIVELVADSDGRSVESLSENLGYSKATIRRDLRELETRGLIERSHGGAVPVTSVGREQTYGQKEVQNLEGKRAIADRAVEELAEGQVVFFDAGTTTMEVARKVPKDGTILGVTNSPRLAVELNDDDNEVKLTGGTLRRRTKALVGPTAESFMQRTNFDLLFLGTNALDADSGLTTPNEDEARMKELMVEKAEKVVLVADVSKLGRRSFVQFAPLGDIDLFITDGELEEGTREAIESAGVDVADGAGQ
ncbi:DeoR/GlpR transcriptional regulator [Haloferax mediterranei ATCC 33500]|uniref:DeoR faimly transcriptional regulator n=1 Tax=Haloferax mediterranei (strain ATCC 33500 / DSM 1411 / JCM 8866 / NBRC 14739 / NCIMB 2177 / R-4) TaxID=523841 RepID=I3R4W2_HALMT|nr:HTH-type transcriptional regulator GlpR [Haloferax mediterranei]AFK19272.1 DeoR family transcriptional regulator [Haloferax mediterranei ATCC 33500]AHZ21369.1 DeoR faimly transcriptional regulator [Haloferax mediterranei ATCC 33500]EMA04539.1 DeoR family transcriptional regulator [Haloferax mediterranei ATCC 33500]MDX5989375.1 HTH-type transcriptional regulator GlpR [Haloferax mediterranei ATCC 33500]QCQ75739.1 DeoR/GlpR transcriptional regulator [Haloferax mediterranei ATCC 33500]